MKSLIVALVLAAGFASAASTMVWELNGYQELVRGRMSGLSLTQDGRLVLGPKLDTLYASDQSQIWSMAQAPDGSLYLGTGNRGRLIKVDSTGRGSVIWTAAEPEIFAVAVDRAGVVYAGTSPEGKVYRIENGRATEYFAPKESYIWALAFAPDGMLYVGTGQQGKIYRVTAPGRGELYYETGQAHITALAFDREGRLLAGSEPNGILYRITGSPAKGFALYNAHLPEIRTILPAPDGSIYISVLGGSIARRVNATSTTTTSTPTITAPGTSITVTADAQVGLVPAPKPEPVKPSTVTPPASVSATITETSGVEKSALYKVLPDNTVETLWTSKEENLYDVATEANGSLLLLTDAEGRIYRMNPRPNRTITLLAQVNESDATRLIAEQRGSVLAAAGSAGKILRLGNGAGLSGWYESPVRDAGTVARWGRLTWLGSKNGIAFKTRSGNSARPDSTWSDWSQPITDPANSSITSPNARFIQWRAEFASANPVPEVDSVTLAYLPQNSAPTVRSITVSGVPKATTNVTAGASTAAFSVTVTDTVDSSSSSGTQSQTVSRPGAQQIQISWQADDPEGDKLSYSVYFRGEDEREWKLLRANITENTYLLEGDVFADGRYFFRVVASDSPSNPVDQAKQAELVSAPVLFDGTPPEVKASRNGQTITVDAEDRTSTLRRCEFSIDAGQWTPVEASDGVTDSPREQFVISIPALPPGEHLISIRVYDSAGNAGLAKAVIR